MRIGLGTTGVYGSDRPCEAYARDVPRLDDAFSFGSSGSPGSGHDPSQEVRPAAIRSALRERPTLLALIALGVVVVAVVVVTALGGSDERSIGDAVPIAGSQQVRVPALGDAAAVFLADGRPVFIVHHEDGTVSVVDAFSTHTPFGVGTLVGWCAATRTFDDLQHGSAVHPGTGSVGTHHVRDDGPRDDAGDGTGGSPAAPRTQDRARHPVQRTTLHIARGHPRAPDRPRATHRLTCRRRPGNAGSVDGHGRRARSFAG